MVPLSLLGLGTSQPRKSLSCGKAIGFESFDKAQYANKATEGRTHALSIGEKFLENDFLYEKLSRETPIYIVTEGNEPPFFTRFFTWDSAKAIMHGNSFQRKLIIVKMAELQS
ncbi:villin putative [Euphorbia peplus]|nr:villin putative [Euphorbia peplus]